MKMKSKTKLRLLQAGGIVSTFAPIAIAVGVNHETYFATQEAGLSLGIGGAMAIMLVVLSALGKAGKLLNSGLKVVACIFVFALLLEPLILNLKFLSGMLLLGECGNQVLFEPTVKRMKKQLDREETASVIKEALRE
jgi:hypothetical protein